MKLSLHTMAKARPTTKEFPFVQAMVLILLWAAAFCVFLYVMDDYRRQEHFLFQRRMDKLAGQK